MAQQTVSSTTIVSLLCEEAPIDGHSSWVCDYRVYHGPEQHDKQDVKDDECNVHVAGSLAQHELEDEDVVVEYDEADDSNEVWIYQLSKRYVSQRHSLSN